MKKIICGVFLSSFFFLSSCSKEETNVNPSQNSKEVTSSLTASTGESIFTDFVASDGKIYSITKYDLSRMKEKGRSSKTLATIIPKTSNGVLTKIQSTAKLVVSGSPYYTTAVYFCDVYKSEVSITVPSGSFALFTPETGASVKGLVNFNNTTIEGSSATQYGNTYTYVTYSIVPIYNSVGQTVPQYVIPRDLTANVFSYSEYTP